MAVLFKIAWRNIWRHHGRSGVLLAAIIAGIWAGVTVAAISNGFINQRFERLIDEVSHIQIHHPEFRTEREASMYIPDAEEVIRRLEEDERIRTYSPRTLAGGMIQSTVTTAGVQIRGVDPLRELETTGIGEQLSAGDFLDADIRNPLVLGRKLADRLKVDIGTRVVLTFQDTDNELTSAAFHVAGIYSTPSPQGEILVFARLEELSSYLSDDRIYHEIAILANDEQQIEPVADALSTRFPDPEILTWYELSPELRLYSDIGNQTTYYLMIVILLALAFGILNTMLMTIFERVRELGMLMAVGMNKSRIFVMISLESILITMTGTVAGMVFSFLSIRYLNINGLDLTAFGEGLMEFGYDPVIYPALGFGEFVGIILLVTLTAILASIYPAIRAIRLQPAKAVRE